MFKMTLDSLIQKYQINRVLEYPATNLLNYFEYKGKVASTDSSGAYCDLVWNFCHFEQMEDSVQFIDEVCSRTDRYIMITIQNNKNFGIILHWIYHKIARKEWDHGKIGKMSPKKLRKAITKRNFTLLEDGFHDLPWFILDVYECGDFLKKLVPASLLDKQEIRPSKLEGWPRMIKSFLAHHYQVLAEKKKVTEYNTHRH